MKLSRQGYIFYRPKVWALHTPISLPVSINHISKLPENTVPLYHFAEKIETIKLTLAFIWHHFIVKLNEYLAVKEITFITRLNFNSRPSFPANGKIPPNKINFPFRFIWKEKNTKAIALLISLKRLKVNILVAFSSVEYKSEEMKKLVQI